MLNTRTQPLRTSCKPDLIQCLLFPRETCVVRSLAGAEVDLGSYDDITTAEFKFLDDATAANFGNPDEQGPESREKSSQETYSSNSAPPAP